MIKSYISKLEGIERRIFDLALLKNILSIQSVSDSYKSMDTAGDAAMTDFILAVLKNISLIENVKLDVSTDSYGNIYVIKGNSQNYPCIVAHTDTVHPIVDKYRIYQQGDILFAFSEQLKRQVGIGGDDKNGVFIALQSLLDFNNLKAVFYRNEEIGRLGSKFSIKNKKDFYNNCNFVLQCDRRGDKDFITNSCGIGMTSQEFEEAVNPYVKKHGFKLSKAGIATDVDVLVEKGIGVCAANIACGYYEPHTDSETVSVKNIGRAYSLVYDLFENIGNKRFEHIYTPLPKLTPKYTENLSASISINAKDINSFCVVNAYDGDGISPLPDMYQIIEPSCIPTNFTCPSCKSVVNIKTETNSLECSNSKCSRESHMTLNFACEDLEISLKYKHLTNTYVYSWYYDAWILKQNAIKIRHSNINLWISVRMYEKEWKKNIKPDL